MKHIKKYLEIMGSWRDGLSSMNRWPIHSSCMALPTKKTWKQTDQLIVEAREMDELKVFWLMMSMHPTYVMWATQ